MKDLTTKIFGKLPGSLLEADVEGRLFKGRAPEGAKYPYVVFHLVSDVPADTFKNDLEDVLVQFSLFSSASSSSEVEDMFIHLKALYDDCSLILTGATLIWMVRQSAQFMIEEHTTPSGTIEIWHYAVEYSVMLEKT
jgi:hypothetical protein